MDAYWYYGASSLNTGSPGVVNLYGGGDSGIRIRLHITSSGNTVTAQLQVMVTSNNVWRYLWNKAWLQINGNLIFSWTDGDAGANPHGFGAGGSPSLGTQITAGQWVNWPVHASYAASQPTGGSVQTQSTFTIQMMIGDRYFNAGDVTWTSPQLPLTNDTASGSYWVDATPYIYDGSWKQATPYIYDGSWKQAPAKIYISNT